MTWFLFDPTMKGRKDILREAVLAKSRETGLLVVTVGQWDNRVFKALNALWSMTRSFAEVVDSDLVFFKMLESVPMLAMWVREQKIGNGWSHFEPV